MLRDLMKQMKPGIYYATKRNGYFKSLCVIDENNRLVQLTGASAYSVNGWGNLDDYDFTPAKITEIVAGVPEKVRFE
jgi:hypothetical protein